MNKYLPKLNKPKNTFYYAEFYIGESRNITQRGSKMIKTKNKDHLWKIYFLFIEEKSLEKQRPKLRSKGKNSDDKDKQENRRDKGSRKKGLFFLVARPLRPSTPTRA